MNETENIQPRIKVPQVLLISGSGRNCGKTSLACGIIRALASSTSVIGLKISPHFHKLSDKQVLLFRNRDFRIYQETDSSTLKDSSRMLKVGALKSFYIQCEDKHILQAWDWTAKIIPGDIPVICESGSFAFVFKAGIHLLVEGKNPDKMKRSYLKNKELSDKIIHFDGKNFNLNFADFSFSGKQWTLKEEQNDQIRRSA